jgi:hypothetical protein
MFHLIQFFRPLRYLEPGTGSILIQLILAALGGGLFFFVKSKWNEWFKKGKAKPKTDDIEENVDEQSQPKPVKKVAAKPAKKAPAKKSVAPATTAKKTATPKSKKRS